MLNLRNCGITLKMLKVVHIQNGQALVHVDLSYNELKGLQELFLPPNLLWLEIDHNLIGNDGLIHIASQLKFGGLDLEYLNLANNRLNNLGLDEIFQFLEKNTRLHKLILDNNVISNELPTVFF